MIKWRNEEPIVGEILDIRTTKKRKIVENSSNTHINLEYYVHYVNFDRRLDEWITYDKIIFPALPSNIIENEKNVKKSSSSSKKKIKNSASSTNASSSSAELTDEMILANMEKENDDITRIKNIPAIVLNNYFIESWYFSPYPEDYWNHPKLYVCEYCLKYMYKKKTFVNHYHTCPYISPPGKKIYEKDSLSMFEINGSNEKLYCQNLCLLSKLFLDHKTLYYDVEPFYFYILCEVNVVKERRKKNKEENNDENKNDKKEDNKDVNDNDEYEEIEIKKHSIVGYFSKEKCSQENYNLACILAFPPYQRKGYGKFLISMSYELTKIENTVGSPEKPLSDLGRISYKSYWSYILLNIFSNKELIQDMSIEKLMKLTGIRSEDLLYTLYSLNIVKQWKSQYVFVINQDIVKDLLKDIKPMRLCDPNYLTWTPHEKEKVAEKK